ncbi:hypothetical protein [Streptomyces sp. NPDC006879]|uniref:hypothetical protein n=1 Tax=Streptomyces sp. NPDC006879 TaxID=3364767 RepID=UPI00368D627C
MNRSSGMFAGMALAFAGHFGGFGAFLLVAALGALGYVLGQGREEGRDLRDLLSLMDRHR